MMHLFLNASAVLSVLIFLFGGAPLALAQQAAAPALEPEAACFRIYRFLLDPPAFTQAQGDQAVSRNSECGQNSPGLYRWKDLADASSAMQQRFIAAHRARAQAMEAAQINKTAPDTVQLSRLVDGLIQAAEHLRSRSQVTSKMFESCWATMLQMAGHQDVASYNRTVAELATGKCKDGPRAMSGLRKRIIDCAFEGNWSEADIRGCSGQNVSGLDVSKCLSGGPCLGEPASGDVSIRAILPQGGHCGAKGLPPCPLPRSCGKVDSINCSVSYSCGAIGYPYCNAGLVCGTAYSLTCRDGQSNPTAWLEEFRILNSAIAVVGAGAPGTVQIAAPPLPDEAALKECREKTTNTEKFWSCVAEDAFPQQYRVTQDCVLTNSDYAAAYLCSAGKEEDLENYKKLKNLKECSDKSSDNYQIAQCLGDAVLGKEEAEYLRCITENKGDYKAAAICAIARNLTTEQQIALSCAIETGGNPYAWVACTGTRLLAREIDKCWSHGIGTENGCFGPNNDYYKVLNSVDKELAKALGPNSDAYKAYKLWKDNVLAPGPNHVFVKGFNTALSDVKNGPGENNDLVRAAKTLGEGVKIVVKF